MNKDIKQVAEDKAEQFLQSFPLSHIRDIDITDVLRGYKGGFLSGFQHAYDNAEEVTVWREVPVNERYPATYGWYMVKYTSKYVTATDAMKYVYFDGNKFLDIDITVTHWLGKQTIRILPTPKK